MRLFHGTLLLRLRIHFSARAGPDASIFSRYSLELQYRKASMSMRRCFLCMVSYGAYNYYGLVRQILGFIIVRVINEMVQNN